MVEATDCPSQKKALAEEPGKEQAIDVDNDSSSVNVVEVNDGTSSFDDDEPLAVKKAKLQKMDKRSKETFPESSEKVETQKSPCVEFVDISSSASVSEQPAIIEVQTIPTRGEASDPVPVLFPTPLNLLDHGDYPDTDNSSACDPSLKRILRNLESQINYDKIANVAPSTSNDIHSVLTITTRNTDVESATSKNVQKKVPEPVYDELLKFFPVKFHPGRHIFWLARNVFIPLCSRVNFSRSNIINSLP